MPRGPKWVNRLEIDERAIVYSEFADTPARIDWSEVVRVTFYRGAPDYPDPLVGMAPDIEWRFYRSELNFLPVPHLADHSERLQSWCARHLAGFNVRCAEEALASDADGEWELWRRPAVPPG
jgi:hypothetical protein